MSQEPITVDNLPLDVREHLMRGQLDSATEALMASQGLSKSAAEALIEAYRQKLRDRKLALDIHIMNHEQEKAAEENRQLMIRWGMRMTLIVGAIVLLYLMAASIQ